MTFMLRLDESELRLRLDRASHRQKDLLMRKGRIASIHAATSKPGADGIRLQNMEEHSKSPKKVVRGFWKGTVRNTPLCESAIVGTALGLSRKLET
jgi:hypothetical protein